MGTRNEKAVEYLKGVDIQTTAMGGFNRTATYEAFKGLSDLYEEILATATTDLHKALDEKIHTLDAQAKLVAEKTEQASVLTMQINKLRNESDTLRANMESMIDKLRSSADDEKKTLMHDAERRIAQAKAETDRAYALAQSAAAPIMQPVMPMYDARPQTSYTPSLQSERATYISHRSPAESRLEYNTPPNSEVARAQQEMDALRKQTKADMNRYKAEAEEQLRRFKSERDNIIYDLIQVRETLDNTLGAVRTDIESF